MQFVLLLLLAQQAPPPPVPPRPPAFMSMKSLPLACFDKPTFEEDGLEFFVCNGIHRISVHTGYAGTFFFACEGKEIARQERFQPGSKTDWKRFDAYLSR